MNTRLRFRCTSCGRSFGHAMHLGRHIAMMHRFQRMKGAHRARNPARPAKQSSGQIVRELVRILRLGLRRKV